MSLASRSHRVRCVGQCCELQSELQYAAAQQAEHVADTCEEQPGRSQVRVK